MSNMARLTVVPTLQVGGHPDLPGQERRSTWTWFALFGARFILHCREIIIAAHASKVR